MKTKLLALLLLTTLHANAIIIEDSPDRLVFDLFWRAPSRLSGIPLNFDNGTHVETGDNGTQLFILSQMSANPYMFVVEIHPLDRALWWTFMVTFQGWAMEQPSNPPDPVWGTLTAPHVGIPTDHLFAIKGNDHAVRVVIGALPVPEGDGTLLLLFSALLGLAMIRPGHLVAKAQTNSPDQSRTG